MSEGGLFLFLGFLFSPQSSEVKNDVFFIFFLIADCGLGVCPISNIFRYFESSKVGASEY